MDSNYKFKHGDIIVFAFESSSCWGKSGVYTAVILYDDKMENLVVHHLNLKLINSRKDNAFNPATDELEPFIDWTGIENITLIGNLCCKDNKNIIEYGD